MSNLVVITFEGAEEAAKVRETLRSVEAQGLLSLDDSAVVVKDAEGRETTAIRLSLDTQRSWLTTRRGRNAVRMRLQRLRKTHGSTPISNKTGVRMVP